MPFEKNKRIEDPPPEAYSRVTNPERFRPLHDAMLDMLNALETRFDIERIEGYGLDDELEDTGLKRVTLERSSIALKPRDSSSAPVTVVFTDFPGLHIRFGRWFRDSFPGCGCDACDESADGEMERLTELVNSLTAGGFREAEFYSPPFLPSHLGMKGRIAYAAKIAYTAMKPGDKTIEGVPPFRAGGTHHTAEFRGPSLRMRRGEPIEGGKPNLILDWKPWPARPEKPQTGD